MSRPDIDGPVFPCDRRKRPLTRHGFKSATDDPLAVDEWEWRHPECLWGAPIPAGLFVLDVDAGHGGCESLAELVGVHRELPATRTTSTRSGGRHYWFASEEPVRQGAGVIGAGLDTRTPGRGYVIVPASDGYSWLQRDPIAPAPAWLLELLRPEASVRPTMSAVTPRSDRRRSGYGAAALRAECDRVAAVPVGVGRRNVELHRAASRLGQLIGAGLLDEYSAAQSLLAASSLPEHEAKSTILSGLNWGVANPRRVSA